MEMICLKCGGELNDKAYCENCKSTILVYEKIKNTSKLLYNQGLQMARVRDISGAVSVLQRSLKIDKHNIKARNLLGLLYFEIGETVSALQQWVISKNMEPEDNLATDYIKIIQENQAHLDKLNNAIKKYNIALNHIKQHNEDLAIIQLKKVITINPKFIKAYALLALCYINEKEFQKAEKVLKAALVIDKSNYIANKYYNELRDEKAINDSTQDLSNPNVYGIKPIGNKLMNSSSLQQVLLVAAGIIVGLAAAMFLISPSLIEKKDVTIKTLQEEMNTSNTDLAATTVELTTANETIASLTQANDELTANNNSLQDTLDEGQKLLQANSYYMNEEYQEAANELYYIDVDKLAEAEYLAIYDDLTATVYPSVSETLYNEGYNLYYYQGDFNGAIDKFTLALKYGQEAYSDEAYIEYSLYWKARSYYRLEDYSTALVEFQEYLKIYPQGHYAWNANDYSEKINNME
jgi:tetratricopeptide (TPR) repeat protein